MNLAESFTLFCTKIATVCALLLVALILVKLVCWLFEIASSLYYFTVATPRFQKNVKAGDQARLLTSDIPVRVVSVGDRYAYIRIPGTNNHETGRSVEVSELYPL